MKTILFFVAIFCFWSTTVFGQTSSEYLQSGLLKHKNQDFAGAIKDYDNAIKSDENNKTAYYNRGTCQLALENFDAAISDFNKSIELDPKFVKAYYSRATTLISQKEYMEALPDLDVTIELDSAFPNALTLRGQIRAQTGDNKGACEDFTKAKELGDKKATTYLQQFCGNEQQVGESLMLDWPDSENWRVGSSQENGEMAMFELIHANETLEDWTEMGNMMSIKGIKNVPMDKAMELMFEQAKQHSLQAKLTFIEKDESVEYPWIIFTIEAPSFKHNENPESQLWYIVQGKQALYTNFRAVKQKTIPDDLKTKWIEFFKTGKIVNK